MNGLEVIKADENKHLFGDKQGQTNLKEYYSQNVIKYSQYDNLESQLKIFFGFDPENLEMSFYPDLSIISDSDSIREMYKLKLENMTIDNL